MKYELISSPNENYTISEQILVNRGIPLNKINSYIRSTDSCLNEPELLDSIEIAAFLLLKHLNNNSKIYNIMLKI